MVRPRLASPRPAMSPILVDPACLWAHEPFHATLVAVLLYHAPVPAVVSLFPTEEGSSFNL